MRRVFALVLLLAAPVLAACGGGNDSQIAKTSSTTSTAATGATGATGTAKQNSGATGKSNSNTKSKTGSNAKSGTKDGTNNKTSGGTNNGTGKTKSGPAPARTGRRQRRTTRTPHR